MGEQDSPTGGSSHSIRRHCSPEEWWPWYGGTSRGNRKAIVQTKRQKLGVKSDEKCSLGSNHVGLGTSGGALASTWRTGYGFFEILVDFRAQMVSLWVTISRQFPDWGHQKRRICVFGSRYYRDFACSCFYVVFKRKPALAGDALCG